MAGEAAFAQTTALQGPVDISLPAWAVTKGGDGYIALATDGRPGLFALRVAADGSISLGPRLASLPHGFTAVSVLATGSRVLVGGAVAEKVGEIAIDNRPDSYPPDAQEALPTGLPLDLQIVPILATRPALFELADGGGARELSLTTMEGRQFGEVMSIATVSSGHLAVLIAASDSLEMAYGDVLDVTQSSDDGVTWEPSSLSSSLGEAYYGHLVAVSDGLVAIVPDGGAVRHFAVQGAVPDEGWFAFSEGEGEIMAVSPAADGSIAVFARGMGEGIAVLRWRAGDAPQSDGILQIAGDDVHDVLAVAGASSEVVLIGANTAKLQTIE